MEHLRIVAAIVILACGNSFIAAESDRPNVVLIMVDDLGYSDIGCYGSEIDTPTLDRLAESGLRFTQFYNTAKCHSSRISLLTGRYPFQAGNQSMNKAVTTAEVLSNEDYFTAMCGKWHLREEPTDFGFQRYFGHLSGACNYYLGDNTFRLNGEKWNVPNKGFYTTVANVDFALKFLNEARAAQQPWFLYLAFNAPHAPLQPLREDYEKYLGRYDVGWDQIRAARIRKQRELGLFASDVEPSPRPDHIAAWESLTAEAQSWESRRMAAYAALIDRVDQELGRLVKNLTEEGELKNTLIMFVSDNGACPYDRSRNGYDAEPYNPKVRWSDSTGWAWARNSPFRFYKQNQFEGGIATPAIFHWPAGIRAEAGSIIHSPAHLIDLQPTIAAVTKADLPTQWPGRDLNPVAGISMAPILKGASMSRPSPLYFLFGQDRAIRDGDWKLVSFRSSPWELYNMAVDRTELNDLASEKSEQRDRMIRQWHDMAQNVDQAPRKNRGVVSDKVTPHRHAEWSVFPGDGSVLPRTSK